MYHRLEPHERNLLLAVLFFLMGIILLFGILLLGGAPWLLIFLFILLILSFLSADCGFKEYNQRLIREQNDLVEAGFPTSFIKLSGGETIRSLFSSLGFCDNGHGYLKKRFFSLHHAQDNFTCYVRWLEDSSDDLCELLRQEYHDFSCLYDTGSSENRLLLFIQHNTISSDDIKQLTSFCMMLLRDELNLRHARMPIPSCETLPRVSLKEQIYLTGRMILPVLIDRNGNGQYMDASSLNRPHPLSYYCTYADCCRRLKAFLTRFDI